MNIHSKPSLLLLLVVIDTQNMLFIHCPECDHRYMVGTRSIVSMHNTSDGVLAYVRCPEGHVTLNTGSPSALEKAHAGRERTLAPVRKAPSLADSCF